MADLRTTFAGISSPNPFWLASAPPTDKAYNVHRAFEAGWGGVVWKTLGEDGPPIVNVSGPRYGAARKKKKGCDCPQWNAVPEQKGEDGMRSWNSDPSTADGHASID